MKNTVENAVDFIRKYENGLLNKNDIEAYNELNIIMDNFTDMLVEKTEGLITAHEEKIMFSLIEWANIIGEKEHSEIMFEEPDKYIFLELGKNHFIAIEKKTEEIIVEVKPRNYKYMVENDIIYE